MGVETFFSKLLNVRAICLWPACSFVPWTLISIRTHDCLENQMRLLYLILDVLAELLQFLVLFLELDFCLL